MSEVKRKEAHRGAAVSFWIEPHWKAMLVERADALGLTLSDYIKATLRYSLLQQIAAEPPDRLDAPAMTPGRLAAFYHRTKGPRASAGRVPTVIDSDTLQLQQKAALPGEVPHA